MKNNIIKYITDSILSHYILWICGGVFVCTIYTLLNFYISYGTLFYTDTDPYTRALRIFDWVQNFQIYEKSFPYSNYPYEDILHFTRGMDIIWTILSIPFMIFTSLKKAIFYGGMVIPPLFMFLSLITIFWGLKPYIKDNCKNNKSILIAFLLLIILPFKLTAIFDIDRPDHHAIMFFIFTTNISIILNYLYYQRENLFILAGILSGIGIWLSSAIEGLLLIGSILTVLCINWIFFEQKIENIIKYLKGLFISSTVAYLINPPYNGYMVLDNLRLSLIHVVLCFLMLTTFIIIKRTNISNKKTKILSLIAGSISSAIILSLLFGEKLLAPVYDEKILKLFISRITEMTNIQIYFYLFSIETILIIGYIFFTQKMPLHIFNITCLFIIYLIPSLIVGRFFYYEVATLIYLNIIFIIYIFNSLEKSDLHKIIAFVYLIFNIFAIIAVRYTRPYTIIPNLQGVVLTDIFIAPQMVFEQQTYSVGFPYHTNIKGITDNHIMLFTSDEKELKKLIQKHLVEYIYLPKQLDFTYYKEPNLNTDKLYGKIITDKVNYTWLEKLSKNTDNYYLYKVNLSKF